LPLTFFAAMLLPMLFAGFAILRQRAAPLLRAAR
jgi:hypothetical protein